MIRRHISFPDLETFIRGCALLVREGVTFEARADVLIITLTGGY